MFGEGGRAVERLRVHRCGRYLRVIRRGAGSDGMPARRADHMGV